MVKNRHLVKSIGDAGWGEKQMYMSKQVPKRKRKFKIRHLIIMAVIIYIVSTFVSQQLKINEIKRQQLEVKGKIEAAILEKKELEEEIEHLNSDEYIEELARKELGLIKPGDIIYKAVPSPQGTDSEKE
jgi:cell division protein FtsB